MDTAVKAWLGKFVRKGVAAAAGYFGIGGFMSGDVETAVVTVAIAVALAGYDAIKAKWEARQGSFKLG